MNNVQFYHNCPSLQVVMYNQRENKYTISCKKTKFDKNGYQNQMNSKKEIKN